MLDIYYYVTLSIGTRPLSLGEIDGLLVPPGQASNLLTDHLRLWPSLSKKCGLVKPSIHISLIGLVGWLYL